MYEQSKLAEVRPDLAVQQAISTIAHEGVHQILHNIGVQQRLSVWPMWLSEGLAEFFAPTTIGARLKWKGAGQVNDLRMFELEQYLKSNAAEGAQRRAGRAYGAGRPADLHGLCLGLGADALSGQEPPHGVQRVLFAKSASSARSRARSR